MASTQPRWTTRGDGFDLEFAVDDVVPLDFIKTFPAVLTVSDAFKLMRRWHLNDYLIT